jgi:hypothetical protein
MAGAKPSKKASGEERRRARRTIIQESFNLFLVIPQALGMARIYLRDLSRLGLSFRSEIELNLTLGQDLKARVYLNPAFFLPVECRVVRAEGSDFGVEFLKPHHAAVQAIGLLQEFLEAAEKAGEFIE